MAARLGFEKAMVGTRRATPRPDCIDRPRKHCSHLAEGWFLERKAVWALSGCMTTDGADYCMLINEWVSSKSRDCLLRPEVDMGAVLVRYWTEMETRCVEGMYVCAKSSLK